MADKTWTLRGLLIPLIVICSFAGSEALAQGSYTEGEAEALEAAQHPEMLSLGHGIQTIFEVQHSALRFWRLIDGIALIEARTSHVKTYDYPKHPASKNAVAAVEEACQLMSQSARWARSALKLAQPYTSHPDPFVAQYYKKQGELLREVLVRSKWLEKQLRSDEVFNSVISGRLGVSLQPGQVHEKLASNAMSYLIVVSELVLHFAKSERDLRSPAGIM